jgi:hypothetical protein
MVQDRAEVSSWHTEYASAKYACNAMTVDMTDVQRSIAAIGQELRFPLDHSLEEDSPIGLREEGRYVVEFVHDLRHFMSYQLQILTLINEEHRAHHQAKHNAMVKTQFFQHGDVVLCHRQVQSQKSKRVSSELLYAFMGPYIVLAAVDSTQYTLQGPRRTI